MSDKPITLYTFFQKIYEHPNKNVVYSICKQYTPPWKNENSNGEMDVLYLYNWSGEKIISPLCKYYYLSDEPSLKVDTFITTMIWSTFNRKWLREWELVQEAYDALESIYRITDEGNNKFRQEENNTISYQQKERDTHSTQISSTDSETDNIVNKNDSTIQKNDNDRDVITVANENQNEHNNVLDETNRDESTNYGEATGIYGFNSSDSKPSNTKDSLSINSENGKNSKHEVNYSEADKINKGYENNDSIFTENNVNEEVGKRVQNDERIAKNIEKVGNVNSQIDTRNGVLRDSTLRNMVTHGREQSPQSLAEEELNFRKWNFWYNMFHDIDSILTLQIY